MRRLLVAEPPLHSTVTRRIGPNPPAAPVGPDSPGDLGFQRVFRRGRTHQVAWWVRSGLSGRRSEALAARPCPSVARRAAPHRRAVTEASGGGPLLAPGGAGGPDAGAVRATGVPRRCGREPGGGPGRSFFLSPTQTPIIFHSSGFAWIPHPLKGALRPIAPSGRPARGARMMTRATRFRARFLLLLDNGSAARRGGQREGGRLLRGRGAS